MKLFTPRFVATVTIGLVLALGSARAAESLSLLLQKGIYAEETEGNLDSAIKIYEQIAAEMAANRPLAAQALYRLAVCYQKQGKKEQAVEILRDLIRQFPSETTLLREARDRLSDLGNAVAEGITIRKLAQPQISGLWAVSPNGRYLAFSPNGDDWAHVMITDLTSGKSWAAVKGTNRDYVWHGVVFSPDSQRIAYDLGGRTLYVANIGGTQTREVFKSDKPRSEQHLEAIGWSSDGSRLIVGRGERDPMQDNVGALDLKSGIFHEIKRIPQLQHGGNTRLSPDARHLAYRAGELPRRKISVVDLESGRISTLVEREVDSIAGWSPNGKKVIFLSDRAGTRGVWAINFRNGEAVEKPELIKTDLGGITMSSVVINRQGEIYYTERKSSINVYVASADFKTGAITQAPRLALDRFPGQQIHPAWSKNGEDLMIDIWQARRRFVIVSMASDEQRDFPAEHAFSGWLQQCSWAEDQRLMLVMGVRAAVGSGIHRFDLDTGKTETLVKRDAGKTWNCMPAIAPDGNSFYYLHRQFSKDFPDGWNDRIVRRDLRSAEETTIHSSAEKLNNWSNLAVTRDGRRIAFIHRSIDNDNPFVGIKVTPISGGPTSEPVRLAGKGNISSLAWTPDGRRLIYNKEPPGTNEVKIGQTEVWCLDLETGETAQLKFPQGGIRGLAVNPDGKRIAFSAGSRSEGDDLWVVEGLLHKLNATPTPIN